MIRTWENFLHQQEGEIGTASVQRWLRPFKILRFDAGNLYLEAKDPFHVHWFEEHIRPKIKGNLVNTNGRQIKVHLSVAGANVSGSKKRQSKKPKPEPFTAPPPFSFLLDELDPYATFAHFYGAEGNLLAHKILCEVAGCPIESRLASHSPAQLSVFNPIYIYGRMGSGKTHLLMATAHALKERGMKVLYARAAAFTENVVNAIRAGEMSAFRRLYRDCDVLLLDDVHILSKKSATQEELFHTFNTLHIANKQIILSASCAPQELQLIEPRLVSRFEWGIVMPLEALKPEEIAQVLRLKAKALQFPLTSVVEEFLCHHFSRNAKSICQALEALVLRLHLQNRSGRLQPVQEEQLQGLLQDLLSEEERHAITPEQILQKVAENYGIRVDDLKGRAQTREAVLPRQLAMYVCRHSLKMPLTKIGELFDRDHSTVMASIRQIEKKLQAPNSGLVSEHTLIVNSLQP